MLCLVITWFILSCADFTNAYERNILHQVNRTAVKGETVFLHCNGALTGGRKDIGWRKDGNVIFNYSPVINQTVTNYTSSRMQVDPRNPRKLQISDVQLSDAGLYSCFPLRMQWRLTIHDSEIQTYNGKLFNIVVSVSTVCVTLCLFITVCLHRKWEKNGASSREFANEDNVYHNDTITSCVYTMTSTNTISTGFSINS